MKIGFDAKRAVQNNTGLGNYSRYLIEILSEYYPDNQYLLFAPKRKENPRLQVLESRENVSFIYPTGISGLFPSFWRTSGIKSDLKRQSPDIFHGLSGELPVRIAKTGIKSIVTVHDLIFLRYPQYYKSIDRFIYKRKFLYACKNADHVIAVSEATKRDIVNYLNIPAEKITVIYQGCHHGFKEAVSLVKKEAVMKKYHLPQNFILYVGSIESRKNLLLIVNSLQFIDNQIGLVAIGKRTPYQDEVERVIKEKGLSDRVYIFNQVPFDDLPTFYQLARIFVYPSYFEGFGIPVLEALSSGVPVIAAKGSCLEEAGGPDSFYVDPDNESELAEKIKTILDDNELMNSMSINGRKYAENFSDKRIADQIFKLYQTLR